ncbi:MAG: tetratricopeptide repeat protein [Cyclobacteriaceae bacterium]|nr:tetratricopeptide repeat protein [Cyclobacteriaceae bacterium]
MVKGFIFFIMMMALVVDPGDIGKINSLKSEAKEAYQKGDFKTAISKYRFLIDSLGVKEDEVQLNLANAYFQAHDTTYTATSYQPVTQSSNARLRSVAHQQLGVLANQQNKYEEALANFKQALKADPTNEDARYNYEMVKKKLEEQKKKEEEQKKNDPNKKEENKDQKDQNKDEKKDQNKDQKEDQKEKQDQENKDKQDQQDKEKQEQDKKEKEKQEQQKDEQEKENKEKKDIPPSVSDKLKQMEMSEEKAKMILEAMKNQEIQYLQQNKRKATKPKDKGKPDW